MDQSPVTFSFFLIFTGAAAVASLALYTRQPLLIAYIVLGALIGPYGFALITNLALLPIPVPNKVRPYKMIAWFEVDEKGNAKLIAFNPSKDGGYNKKIREMLAEVRFRPAVRPDGTPVRDTVSIVAEAPR